MKIALSILMFCFLIGKTNAQDLTDTGRVDLLEKILATDSLTFANYARDYGNEIIVMKESIFAVQSISHWNGIVIKYMSWNEIDSYLKKTKQKRLILWCHQVDIYSENLKAGILFGIVNSGSMVARSKGNPFMELISNGFYVHHF